MIVWAGLLVKGTCQAGREFLRTHNCFSEGIKIYVGPFNSRETERDSERAREPEKESESDRMRVCVCVRAFIDRFNDEWMDR